MQVLQHGPNSFEVLCHSDSETWQTHSEMLANRERLSLFLSYNQLQKLQGALNRVLKKRSVHDRPARHARSSSPRR